MRVPIRNSSEVDLEIQIEPWLDTITLAPGENGIVEGMFGENLNSLEIDYESNGVLVLFAPAGTTLKKI